MTADPGPSDEAAAEPASLAALGARTDLAIYGQSNALLLFALQLAYQIEDIGLVASTSLTDGPDDKKCDLVYVDRDGGKVVIGQGYWAQDPSRPAAPSNKAADLNTAIGWLLSGDPESFPEQLRPAAAELDAALRSGAISSIDLWYAHNLPESPNVAAELGNVQTTASALLRNKYPDVIVDSVTAVEVGRQKLEALYAASHVAILISDELSIPITGGFEEKGDRWEAFCTSVPGEWLRDLYIHHGTDLFAANVRDYLGSRRSDRNINFNIKETARTEPLQFWAFNNGLTALVNDYSVRDTGDGGRELTVRGISIVNGAQTTGALGSVEVPGGGSLGPARVLARFVKCQDGDVVRDIIRYNNSQNRVEAADFRSGDAVQERLRDEFQAIPDADYRGGRRGGERDAIERPPNLLPSGTVAQSLAAFHREPNVAYNEKRRIWESDETYARFFSDKTTARHILFAYSLLRSVEAAKQRLLDLPEHDRTQIQAAQLAFLRRRGSLFLLVAAIASSLETVLGRAIPDGFELRFRQNVSPRSAAEQWDPIVGIALAFASQLDTALEQNLENRERVSEALSRFRALVEATREANAGIFDAFAQLVSVG